MAPISEGGDNPQCQIPEVQALVSKFSLYGTLISGILSAIISPRLGALSDRYGRTRLMTASTCGMLIGEAITIVVAKYPDTFSVNWLLLGYFFDGLGGSFIAAMAVANAYASDCTPPTRRHVAFGYYHGCLFAGIALGPLLSGFVVKATGQILSVFYLAIAAHSVYTIWLLFIVPESLSKERQRTARKKFQDHADAAALSLEELDAGFAAHFLPMGLKFVNVLSPLSVLWPNAPGTNPKLRYNLVFLAAVDTTLFGVAMGAVTIVLLYSEFMFDWGNFETSIFVAIVNSCRVTILIVVLPLITRLLRGPASRSTQRPSGSDNIDLGFIRISIIFDILGFVGYSTVREGWLFILSGAIASVGGMGSPTLSAGLTKHVPPDQTGKVLGAMGLLHAMARLVGPIVFNLIYAKTVKTMPQTVFICLAATFGLALIFSLLIRPNSEYSFSSFTHTYTCGLRADSVLIPENQFTGTNPTKVPRSLSIAKTQGLHSNRMKIRRSPAAVQGVIKGSASPIDHDVPGNPPIQFRKGRHSPTEYLVL